MWIFLPGLSVDAFPIVKMPATQINTKFGQYNIEKHDLSYNSCMIHLIDANQGKAWLTYNSSAVYHIDATQGTQQTLTKYYNTSCPESTSYLFQLNYKEEMLLLLDHSP